MKAGRYSFWTSSQFCIGVWNLQKSYMGSGRSTKKILQGGPLLAINGAMTPIGSHLVHPWSFPTAKGTYKSTSLKRQIIWTYPPFFELPGVNFPECKRLNVSGIFFGGDSLTILTTICWGFSLGRLVAFDLLGSPSQSEQHAQVRPSLTRMPKAKTHFSRPNLDLFSENPNKPLGKHTSWIPKPPKNERNPYGKLLVSGAWGFWFQGYVENFLDHPFGVLEAVDVGFLGRSPSREPSAILSYIC